MNISALQNKPWNDEAISQSLLLPRGMLGAEERSMLYYICKNYYNFSGAIVDAGAYIGASAYCMATGVFDNTLYSSRLKKNEEYIISSYDLFKTDEKYVLEDVKKYFPLFFGNDYLSVYKFQIAKFIDIINIHAGDFLVAPKPKEKIEILFIDVAKTFELNSHIIVSYFPLLIEGKSLIIHQDYYHVWHPYIHMSMEILSDYIMVVDGLINYQSRLYYLKKNIPYNVLEEAARLDLTHKEQMAIFDSAIEKDSGKTKMMTSLARVLQCIKNKGKCRCTHYFDKLTQEREFDQNALYGIQSKEVYKMIKK